jgi:hypothetical protein
VIGTVAISIDGASFGNATSGMARKDVCQAFPDVRNCGLGWSFPLDTTLLANGTHVLQVTATVLNGSYYMFSLSTAVSTQNTTISTFFTVSNSYSASPISQYVDAPNSGAVVSGVVSFAGWALHKSGDIANVTS